ncbi:MAG: autotransporter domain-containing protein [Rhizomicrobium sp.]
MQIHAKNFRGLLRHSVSIAAMTVACFGLAIAADASTVTLSSSNSPYTVDNGTGDTVVVTSGSSAFLTNSASSVPSGDYGLIWSNQSLDAKSSCSFGGCTANADTISVENGASLTVYNPADVGWLAYGSLFQVSGDITFVSGETDIIGTNSFLGNVTLESGTSLYLGESWATSAFTFSNNTVFNLEGTSALHLNLGTGTTTFGGIIAGDTGSTVELGQGTLVLNGSNTAASPFQGTFTVDASSTLIVGDASHTSAVFGDPTNAAAVINLANVSGSSGTLAGYGTIYGTVNNNGGVVQPGGTDGSVGTLTVTNYSQNSTGTLEINVTPTSASSLKVLGSASFDGSLVINLADGTYGNAVYNVVSASTTSGSFSTVSTSGNVTGAIVGVTQTDTGYSVVTEKASSAQTFGHILTANRSNVNNFNYALYDRLETNLPSAGGKPVKGDGEFSAWLAPVGSYENLGRDGTGYALASGGFNAGAEYRMAWHNAVIGLAGSYMYQSMAVKGETTSAVSNAVNFGVYGGADLQYGRVDATLFYNMYNATAKRDITDYGTAKSTPSGWSWGGSVQLSKSIYDNLISPYVRGVFGRYHQDGASETGASLLALQYEGVNQSTFVGDVGVRIHAIQPTADDQQKLEFSLAVAHDFNSLKEVTTGSFTELSGSSFTYSWAGDSQNALKVGAEYSNEVTDGIELYARTNGTFTLYKRAVEVSFGGRYRF